MSFLNDVLMVIDGWPAWAKLSLVVGFLPGLVLTVVIFLASLPGRKH